MKINISRILVLIIVFLCSETNANYFKPVPNQMDFPLNFSSTDNQRCKSDSATFVTNLNNYTLWAYRMWDASAKFSIGVTEGNIYQLGHFDECLSIKQPFKAQYCLTTIHIKLQPNISVTDPFSLKYKPYSSVFEKIYYTNDPNKLSRQKIYWGICVPSSCQDKDVANGLTLYLNNKNLNSMYIEEYTVEIENGNCVTKTKWFDFDKTDHLFCGICAFLLIIIVVCTIIDNYYISESSDESIRKKKLVKYLLCFSARENLKDLNDPGKTNDALQIIYGLRIFMIFCIVIGHSYVNMVTGSVLNIEDIEQKNRTFQYILLKRGEVLVDLFFVVSGLLNTYAYLVQSEKKSMSPFRIAILRYTRLSPVFAIVTYFYASIFYKLGSGPVWNHFIGAEKDYCVNNWWTNILFLNNYINLDKMCILQGWYIAADFQLALLAIPLNMLIKRNTKLCWFIITSVLMISISIPFLIVYYFNMEPIMFVFNTFVNTLRKSDYFRYMYTPVYTRATTFIIGMILGSIFYRLRNTKLMISRLSSSVIYNIGMLITFSALFFGSIFYNPYTSYSSLQNALFAAFVRPVFAVGCSISILITSFGNPPLIKKILFWKFWIPFAKLSFSVYMVHWAIQLAHIGVQRTAINVNVYTVVSRTIVEFILSYVLAFILYICVENPISKLVKYLLSTEINISCAKTH